MNDLASGTSSWSTKLVHGGLRYLEYYEFRLVREALIEREMLWRIAPHIIRPLRFVLPHHDGLRPAWLLRLGLFLYDHIGGRKLLPPTRSVDLDQGRGRQPLAQAGFTAGFEYSDCCVDDARLVVLTARDAADRGADIRTRTRARRDPRRPTASGSVTVEDSRHGARATHRARACWSMPAGPWVEQVLASAPAATRAPRCGWCRARTSSCRGSTTTTAPTSSRTRTAASSSPFPTGRLHADRHHRSRLSRRPGRR